MKRWPVYPFLFGLFPLLTIYQSNTGEVGAIELLLPIALVLAGTLVVLLATWPLMRNVHRAAIFTAAVVWCFMTFRRWTDALGAAGAASSAGGLNWQVCVCQVILLMFVFHEARRRVKNPIRWTANLNLVAAAILTLPILVTAWQLTENWYANAAAPVVPDHGREIFTKTTVSRAQWPDIYFIVLDAHARADVLSEDYHFDPQPFLQHLRDRGFFIADSSNSNYCFTELSVASMLNVRYLDEFDNLKVNSFRPLYSLIRNNAVAQTLHSIGYKCVAFQTAWSPIDMPDSDVYYDLPHLDSTLTFYQLLIDSTAAPLFPDARLSLPSIPPVVDLYQAKRLIIQNEFAHVPDAIRQTGPKFVFLHIFAPHPPFVFAADGSDPGQENYGSVADPCIDSSMTVDQYRENYRNQLIYTDRQAQSAIDQILAASSGNPPVIVVVGDHGARSGFKVFDAADSDLRECMGNLTAVLLPGKANQGLYPTITPVNLLRVVLNDYFDAKLPLLPDKSFFSDPTKYAFRDVSGRLAPALAER